MQGNDDLGTNTTGLPGVGSVKLKYAARRKKKIGTFQE